jgi:hypothetical protein
VAKFPRERERTFLSFREAGPVDEGLRKGVFKRGPAPLRRLGIMQTIFPTLLTPAQYAEQEYHRQVKAPAQCPNCQRPCSLEALGYYSRFITQALAAVLEIWIRRFLCRHCCISVSCLPQFAQPYRVVNSDTVEAGFNGQNTRPDVQRWHSLIVAYWRRLEAHLPKLVQRVGPVFGRLALNLTAPAFWEQWVAAGGSLAAGTMELVARFRTCLFGTYRCHQRQPSRVA